MCKLLSYFLCSYFCHISPLETDASVSFSQAKSMFPNTYVGLKWLLSQMMLQVCAAQWNAVHLPRCWPAPPLISLSPFPLHLLWHAHMDCNFGKYLLFPRHAWHLPNFPHALLSTLPFPLAEIILTFQYSAQMSLPPWIFSRFFQAELYIPSRVPKLLLFVV